MSALNDSTLDTPIPYFGYGSNLWLEQMAERCPGSTFVGIALPLDHSIDSVDVQTHVWGIAYSLTEPDEAILDRKEGVPHNHTNEIHDIDFWPTDPENAEAIIDISAVPEKKPMLLYIDRERMKDSKPREEYVYRMNMGIADALKMGIPSSYVEKVMRTFIPERDGPVPAAVQALIQAQKQTVVFRDNK
ncbi:hypothetical protein NA57DRAFT_64399 [Rhizodiscina lignyota]|uniref:gamma-glutamylcyclotransferase n=1 Tax=Rhizodiscina lignyota TaxID=1504668 RepID=A0A9P4IL23_9PEZI|nr:hypothetical protein NA57DRAFT_64399 [Rhizodiscina lignyota]